MATVPEGMPDVRKRSVALGISSRAIRKTDGSEDDALNDWLTATALVSDGTLYFRPWLAAARWLRARPRVLVKGDGAEWQENNSAAKTLEGQQKDMDGLYELPIPVFVAKGAPGPEFSDWR